MNDETELQVPELSPSFLALLKDAPPALGNTMLSLSAAVSEETGRIPTLGETLSVLSYWLGALVRANISEENRERVACEVANTMIGIALKPEDLKH